MAKRMSQSKGAGSKKKKMLKRLEDLVKEGCSDLGNNYRYN